MSDELKLLVEWSSPWREFLTSIRPALAKSPQRLAGEARTGLLPYRGMLASWVLEVLLVAAAIVLPAKLAGLRPYQPPPLPKYDVIYFSGEELPQTEDLGGAKAGRFGRAGGQEARHRTQTIRVSRGDSLRERVVDAPKLNLPQSNSAVANLLAYKVTPGPAPTEGLKPLLRAPSLADAAVAPTPQVEPRLPHSAPALSAAVIPPSPVSPQRDLMAVRIPGSQAIAVIPPPVSAPEQATDLHPKLTLPPASVVAPPPLQVAHDVRSMGPGFGPGELQKQVVPPPVQVGSASYGSRSFNGLGSANVVPPPVQLNGPATARSTLASLGTPNVVAPPVQVEGTTRGRSTVATLGSPAVVPPPVQIGGGSLHQHTTGLGGGTTVVPPPPVVSTSGLGRGTRGAGLGAPLDAGSLATPPSNVGGSGGGTGIVLSSQPGSKVGVPGASGGSLALSPLGGAKPGLGGPGSGSDIARGEGPGSALSHEGPGATTEGNGRGADTLARSGTSPFPGPGGAGTGTVGKPPMPGVSVHGGSNVITLPSFGADGSAPSPAGRSSKVKDHAGPDITIVGSSRSGGALNLYGALKGDKVYTIYIDTALGTAVMEYADPSSAAHPYADDLTAPKPVRADLPANLKRSRLVIACVLDRSGMLRNAQVLEKASSETTTKVLAALSGWKFRPVFRGNEPVEVNAILGFAIDTR